MSSNDRYREVEVPAGCIGASQQGHGEICTFEPGIARVSKGTEFEILKEGESIEGAISETQRIPEFPGDYLWGRLKGVRVANRGGKAVQDDTGEVTRWRVVGG